MKPEVGSVCRGRMHSGRWRSPGLRRTRVRPSLAYRQNLLSSLKTRERHFTLQSTLSRYQRRRAWRVRGVSGRLARGTLDLCPAASRGFPIVLGDTEGTYARISYPDAVRATTAALNASILTCVITTRPSRTWSTCGNVPTDHLYSILQRCRYLFLSFRRP